MGVALRIRKGSDGGDSKVRGETLYRGLPDVYAKAKTRASNAQWLEQPPLR